MSYLGSKPFTIDFLISRRRIRVRAPSWVPRTGWSIHSKGYIIYTSRATASGIRRGISLHRLVIERLLGRPLSSDEHVHHMDYDKGNNCPCNLLLVPISFNPTSAFRDPFTGQYLSTDAYHRRYGYPDDAKTSVATSPISVEDEEYFGEF